MPDTNETHSSSTGSSDNLETFFDNLVALLDQGSKPFDPYQGMWSLAIELEKAFYEDPICVADPEAALISLVIRLSKFIRHRDPSLVLEPAIKFLDCQEELDADRTQQLLTTATSEHPKLTQVWRWAVGLSEHANRSLPAEQIQEIVSALDAAPHYSLGQASLARVLLDRAANLEVSLVWRCCEIVHFAEKQHPADLMEHLNKINDPNWASNAATLVLEWTADFLIDSLPEGIQEPNHLAPAICFFAKSKRSMVNKLFEYTITNWDHNVREALLECGFEDLIKPSEDPWVASDVPSRPELEKRASRWPIANVTQWMDDYEATSTVLWFLRNELKHGNVKPFASWLQAMKEDDGVQSEYDHKSLLSYYSMDLDVDLREALSTVSRQDLECLLPGLQYFVDFPYHMDHVADWNSELLYVHLLCNRSNEYADWSKSTQAHWIAGLDSIWGLAARRADRFNLDDSSRWETALQLCTNGLQAGINYQTNTEVDKTDLTLPYGPEEMIGLVTKEQLATYGGQLADILDDQGETWRRIARIRRQLGQFQPAVEAIDAALEQTEDEKIRSRREAEKQAYQNLLKT